MGSGAPWKMTDEFVASKTPESLERINVRRRVGQPDEVASMIECLAADAPTYLTGSVIYIDGGQTAMALLP
jgi:NAD(P)-dependent dehydrogenase (short-subunit alcohol dehydrogenase family)